MHDSEAVRGDDLREALGMHAKLAFPDVHCDVLDLGGKGDTGVVEQDVQPSVRRHHRVHHLRPVLFRRHVEVHVVFVAGIRLSFGKSLECIIDIITSHVEALLV